MLKIINPLLFLAILLQMATIIMLKVSHNYVFGEIHTFNGFLIFLLIIIHLSLNFGWIKVNFFKKKK